VNYQSKDELVKALKEKVSVSEIGDENGTGGENRQGLSSATLALRGGEPEMCTVPCIV